MVWDAIMSRAQPHAYVRGTEQPGTASGKIFYATRAVSASWFICRSKYTSSVCLAAFITMLQFTQPWRCLLMAVETCGDSLPSRYSHIIRIVDLHVMGCSRQVMEQSHSQGSIKVQHVSHYCADTYVAVHRTMRRKRQKLGIFCRLLAFSSRLMFRES